MIEATLDADKTLADLAEKPNAISRGTARCLNRGIASGQSVVVKGVAADIGLKQKDVRGAMKTTKANARNLVATLAADIRRIPLEKFKARGPLPSRRRPGGVTYKFGAATKRITTAFRAQMRSGHVGVFARKGKARTPIRELQGPSIRKAAEKPRPEATAKAIETFQNNFDHEISFAKSGDVSTD